MERPRKVVSLFPHELSSPKHNVISLECTKQQRAKLALGARTSCRFRGERKLGEAGCEVRVSFGLDPALVRFLTVARIDGVDNIHPLDDLPDRTEAHFVEKRIVFEVDKDLRRARVLARGGERDRPSLVMVVWRLRCIVDALQRQTTHGRFTPELKETGFFVRSGWAPGTPFGAGGRVA